MKHLRNCLGNQKSITVFLPTLLTLFAWIFPNIPIVYRILITISIFVVSIIVALCTCTSKIFSENMELCIKLNAITEDKNRLSSEKTALQTELNSISEKNAKLLEDNVNLQKSLHDINENKEYLKQLIEKKNLEIKRYDELLDDIKHSLIVLRNKQTERLLSEIKIESRKIKERFEYDG